MVWELIGDQGGGFFLGHLPQVILTTEKLDYLNLDLLKE